MGLIGILYVEVNTEEAQRAVEAMNSSGLKHQVFFLSKVEADERRRNCDEMPMLVSWPAICKGLEAIKWYSRCYGKGGPQHQPYCDQEKRVA